MAASIVYGYVYRVFSLSSSSPFFSRVPLLVCFTFYLFPPFFVSLFISFQKSHLKWFLMWKKNANRLFSFGPWPGDSPLE